MDEQEIYELLYEKREMYRMTFINTIKENRQYTYPLVDLNKLTILYSNFMTFGFVLERDYKLLENIIETYIEIVAIILENTYMCGHTQWSPIYDILDAYNDRRYRKSIPKKVDEELNNIFYKGMISDYACDKLEKLVIDILISKTPEEKLLNSDKILNIIHCRGNLSEFFVEGGRRAIDKISYD